MDHEAPPHLDRFSPPNGENSAARINGFVGSRPPSNNQDHAQASTSAPNVVLAELYQVPGVKHKAPFRSLSYQVQISQFCFAARSFKVHAEITIHPNEPNLTLIYLHLGKDALLPSECAELNGSVTLDNVEVKYRRRNPIEYALTSNQNRSLADFEPKYYHQLKENDYNLEILIPEQLRNKVKQRRTFRLAIDVFVKNPKKGLNFVDARSGDSHMYTYHCPYMSGTREWLPCFDEPDQLALWEISFELDRNLLPVASAELTDKCHDENTNLMTYAFTQNVPTNACNMGWCVGKFRVEPHQESPTIHTFSLPGLSSFVKYTTTFIDKMVEFLEEKLSCRLAYPTLKIVFVDQTTEDIGCYSSMLVISTNLLYHKKIIDVVQEVRQQLIHGIAQQFFGCFISPSHWIYWWMLKALARLLTSLYVETKLGLAESRWQLKRIMDDVCDYEHQWGKILLSPNLNDSPRINLHFDARHEYTCSPLYVEAMIKKGFLTMRMLLKRLGQEPFLRVLHRMLTVGLEMSEKRSTPGAWKHLLTCTEAFFRSVSTVTGSEIPTFVEQWLKTGGHAAFSARFEFNRKRNMIELEVKQDDSEGNGRSQYAGPLSVVVQEIDGAFTHTVQIDGATSHADLQCHSKGRRQKKKKIPILTGEEVEFDLSNMDAESPVLWIRLDHDFLLIREISISQPIFHWEYMLKYERDVIAQMEALERIQIFPSAQSKSVIVDTISNDKFFYRIRCRSAFVLSAVQNRRMEALNSGVPVLVNMFKEVYGSKASPNIPKSNNFVVTSQNLQQYFVMQSLPQAVARLRKQTGECYEDVLAFLLDLIKFNDNSTNRYSDDFYRASLYSSLAACVHPSEYLPLRVELPENLSQVMRSLLQEFTYALNNDTINPSYGRVCGIAALSGLYQLQKNGYIPLDSELLWMFAQPNVCSQMRRAAIALIVDRISSDGHAADTRHSDLLMLLEMAETDQDPSIRHLIVKLLATTPPFATYNNTDFGYLNPCNTIEIADMLWRLLTNREVDCAVRSGISDLYFSMFGLGVPPVKGGPAEAPGHHRAYVTMPTASSNLASSQWHSSSYEAARRSPPRVTNFGDDSLM
ncbi:unnamed protein product [Caenorhabditis bovis]|uniref:Transcription initiation factor TFIID subunit 2 n=1 Tax=Caenorhabditis bovis TaxID=2654633 RepID=A0A8S1FA60_9PELO|nr:unnamed protein product [Caenorhabditis bovis]